MARYIQDPDTGKLIPADEYVTRKVARTTFVQGDIEAFKSPIDGQIIDDRGKLRRHNKLHGVTNVQDYGSGWFKRKARERQEVFKARTPEIRRDRVNDIKRAIEIHKSR